MKPKDLDINYQLTCFEKLYKDKEIIFEDKIAGLSRVHFRVSKNISTFLG